MKLKIDIQIDKELLLAIIGLLTISIKLAVVVLDKF